MKARTLILQLVAAAAALPLAAVSAFAQSAQVAQANPRIIQVPESAPEPKRPAPEPQKRQETAKPPVTQTPATPRLRAPAQTKPNRKIWI